MIRRLIKIALMSLSVIGGAISVAALLAFLTDRFAGPAFGQATETAKITEAYLDRGVLGITCAALLLAVIALFTLLIKSYNERSRLLEVVIKSVEQGKNSSEENTEATKANTAAIAGLTKAVETLAREAEGEARETRHGVANLAQIVAGNAEMLRAVQAAMGTMQAALGQIPTITAIRDACREKPL